MSLQYRWVGLICVAASFGELVSCTHSCTEMGCVPGVEVSFSEPLSAPGQYRLTLDVDGTAMSCTTTVPPSDSSDCSDPRIWIFGRGEEVRDGDSVTELPPKNFAGFFIDGEIESIRVTVEREADVLAEETFAPEYQGIEINGPGCGECPGAHHELALGGDAGAD